MNTLRDVEQLHVDMKAQNYNCMSKNAIIYNVIYREESRPLCRYLGKGILFHNLVLSDLYWRGIFGKGRSYM